MCWMRYVKNSETDREIGDYTLIQLSIEELFCKETKGLSVVSACAKLYKKCLFSDIRFPVNKINEDLFTTYKVLSKIEKITIITPELYYYYLSDNSITRKKWTKNRLDEAEGSRELIKFFKHNGMKKAERFALDRYRRIVDFQIREIKAADISEKRKWYRKLRRMYKGILIKHMKIFPLKQYRWCYETAFPISSWLYWTIRGIVGKITRR